jgi:hypothetical protein
VQRLWLILLLMVTGLASARDLVVVPIVDPLVATAPATQVTLGLHIYALPGFELLTSNPQITGVTTVSQDGTRLYELDLSLRRIRTFTLPTLQLISDVPAPQTMPYIAENTRMLEHPRRPGVLMLIGAYWIDARTGNWVETPARMGVPAPLAYASSVSISGNQNKLIISYYPVFPTDPAGGVRVIDLDNPRQVQSLAEVHRGAVLMESAGLVAMDADYRNIEIRDLQTQGLLQSIKPPPGLQFLGDFSPINGHELLHSAWAEASNEQVLMRLDLQTSNYTELLREVRDENDPGFGLIEIRGNRILLSVNTVPPGFMGQPYSVGQMRELDLNTGATTALHWPLGGGPISGGNKLAVGTAQPIPIGTAALSLGAFLLLAIGIFSSSLRRQ